MESLIETGMLIEAVMLSFLLALWLGWLGLRSLFRLMPGVRLEAVPIRLAARRTQRVAGRNVA
jgi:hypothetical protein